MTKLLHGICVRKKPINHRLFAVFAALLVGLSARRAIAQSAEGALDRAAITARVTTSNPGVRLAEAQVDLARAHRVGADVFVRENPSVQVWGGPRVLATGDVLPDLTLTLMWPFDLAGTRAARVGAADANLRLAEARAQEARRDAVGEALERWIEVLVAREQVALERRRVELEETVLRVAQTRRRLGAAGDEEPALATVSLATARARVTRAQGEAESFEVVLRGLVGLEPGDSTPVAGALEDGPALVLETLEAGLARRGDVQRVEQQQAVGRADLNLEQRSAWPTPRVGFGIGRENEYFGRIGVDVGLPVFQRNQTNIAVARARVELAAVERATVLTRARTELRVAWIRYQAAQRALQALTPALAAADDGDRLGTRAFELGQRDLAMTLLIYRENAAVRQAQLDARAALARARIVVERSAGVFR